MIALKRAYDPAARADGVRILVERLWPRGIAKAALPLASWHKDVAPSRELRQWFAHDPAKWAEFRRRYQAELRAHPEVLRPLLAAARRGRLTLIYSSHDQQHNNAVVLKHLLEARISRGSQRRLGAAGPPSRREHKRDARRSRAGARANQKKAAA